LLEITIANFVEQYDHLHDADTDSIKKLKAVAMLQKDHLSKKAYAALNGKTKKALVGA